jgi:peptide/nickel transport system substrate-binding protein/microcin C transport system substrate-binding protein
MTVRNLAGLLLGLSLFVSFANATEANPKAPKGGVMNFHLESEPESLHPIMGSDLYVQYFNSFVHDSLCAHDLNTWEFVPRIAEKWEVSKDGLQFTFTLRPDAYFHNGDNVTAEDVKFSLEHIREPKLQALDQVPYYEGITKVEVLEKYKIRFTAKEKYFKNLSVVCGLTIIPKSVYGDVDKSVKLQKEAVGAGPYKFEKLQKGQMIVLKKFDKWYGDKLPIYKGYYNFDTIYMKFTKETPVATEKLKKGDLDYMELTRSDDYLTITGKPFKAKYDGGKFWGKAVKNLMPKSYGYIGFNFLDPILKDLNVRTAIAHLFNREEMNKKFYENLNNLANGPVPVNSPQAAVVKPIEFNPGKARELLAKSGWTDSDKDGVLDKMIDGKKVDLRLSYIYARKESEKQWTIFKEDAKKAGVDIDLKYLEWNSFLKTIDDNKMQLWAMAWGGGDVEMDPKQIWHSSSSKKGGSNRGSYSNPEVDKLIDEGRAELDAKKRTAIFKKAYTLIAKDVPYVFLFNQKYDYYAMSKKMGQPGDTFKYDFGSSTWWALP